jgi:hypothetical protein
MRLLNPKLFRVQGRPLHFCNVLLIVPKLINGDHRAKLTSKYATKVLNITGHEILSNPL